MPFEKRVGLEAEARLDAMAALLERPREVLVALAEGSNWRPAPGSHAEQDLAYTGFSGNFVMDVVHRPRALAVLYSRVGADHLAGMGALLRARELWFPAGAVARAAVEHGARTVRVLDPRTDVRGRCACAWLEELASAYFSCEAVAHLTGKQGDSYRFVRKRWKKVREIATATFAAVELRDDPFKWSLEGHAYLRIADVVEAWTEWRDDDLPGRGIYDALSLYPHPQGFAAREEVEFTQMEVSGSRVVTDVAYLARMASAAFAAWYDGFTLVVSYHGYGDSEIDALAEQSACLSEWGQRNSSDNDE
jgi:hypothetical protein